MKKFLSKISVFTLLMALIYVAVGKGFHCLESYAKGESGRIKFIHDQLKASHLIMGSSRAFHHYNPHYLTPYYNIGEDRMGIIFNYGRLQLIEERNQIKSIIYDVEPDYDLLEDDNTTYLGNLRPYYWRGNINSIFHDVDATERFKMLFPFYPFNSRLTKLLSDARSGDYTEEKGYLPYKGCQAIIPEKLPQDKHDKLKYEYLQKLISTCRQQQIQLIFAASPQLSYQSDSVFIPLQKICKAQHIPLLNHFCDTRFTKHREWFHNANHLNSTGADIYSKLIAEEIQRINRKQ